MGVDVPHRRRARGRGARHRQLHLDRRALFAGRPDHRGDHHHRHPRTLHGHPVRNRPSTRISLRAEGARVSEIQIADVAMGFRTRHGEVFQTYSLFPWLSVRRNIEFGPEIKKAPPPERRKTSSELIRLMRLDGFADAYPNALSGGMKQRAAIARALANDPEVLLMDE